MLPMQLIHRIFRGIDNLDKDELLKVLRAKTFAATKGSVLLSQGECNENIYVLLGGKAHAVRYTSGGREVDYALLEEGALFGYALAFSGSTPSPVSVFADSECKILSFSYDRLLSIQVPEAKIILHNLIEALSDSYFVLQRRLHYLTSDSLREKILSYLFDQCDNKDCAFVIPLDRSALAAYLYCDRSALCRELSRLKADGIIWYRGNQFRFLNSASINS